MELRLPEKWKWEKNRHRLDQHHSRLLLDKLSTLQVMPPTSFDVCAPPPPLSGREFHLHLLIIRITNIVIIAILLLSVYELLL